MKSNLIFAVIMLVIGSVFGYFLSTKILVKTITQDQAKVKVEAFLKENNIPFEVGTIEAYDDGLYKVELTSTEGSFFAYLSKSGKALFQGILELDADKAKDTTADSNGNSSSTEVVKSDRPVVELFVMSHCPYGTQIEKGILPVLETLKDKIDFQLKFVNYAMHGEKEIAEELNQYCINKLYPDKFNAYLECFLADETGSSSCIQAQGLSASSITSCTSETDKEFNITADYADKSTWKGSYPPFGVHNEDNEKYGVGGSPTLVINGVTSNSGRSPSSLLASICAAFNTAPEECNTELSTENPAPGFGFDTTGSATDSSCN